MAEIEDKIHRSPELQDILGTMPHWLLRWGTGILLIVFINIILVGFIIKYPDSLYGGITITCENPPAKLVARTNGRINLLFKDNDKVKRGDFIAVIENTSSIEDILNLKKNLAVYEQVSEDPMSMVSNKINFSNSYNLGELQESYNKFKSSCEEYELFLDLQQNLKKIEAWKNQIALLTKRKDLLENKKTIAEREYKISKRQFESDSALLSQKALSQFEFDRTEGSFIRTLSNLQAVKEESLRNSEELSKMNSNINDLFLTNKDQKTKLELAIKNSFKNLKTTFMLWQQKYIVISPLDGTLSLFDFWNNNQVVNQGDEVAHVIAGADNIFGKLYITGTKFGKVKKGQKVKIMLDSYPAAEYGFIWGNVESISEVNKNNIYAINVALTNGLITTYKDNISFKHEMKGYGEIITEDLSFIERVFYKFKTLFIKKYGNES